MNENIKPFELHNDPHAEWIELCALSTAEEISVEQRAKLQMHLDGCPACQEVYEQYVTLVYEEVPAILGKTDFQHLATDDEWDHPGTKSKLMSRVERLPGPQQLSATPTVPVRSRRLGIATAWSGLAAAIAICFALGGYTLGKRVAPTIAQVSPSPDIGHSAALEREKFFLNAELQRETERLQRLQGEEEEHQKLINQLQSQLTSIDQHAKQVAADKTVEDHDLQTVRADRDTLIGKLHEVQQNYEVTQAELVKLRTQRSQDALHYASLELEVNDLRHNLKEQDRRVSDQTQYLASDRDIRELMGARQLYIADVTDVDSTGNAKKAFGRVFYTKGKSLIFYAFDLDQSSGLKSVSTFQAWARQGSDNAKPASLGIFYVDNEANRRWVLRADDPKLLEQINSVFVTVEPKGGSQKPTGKPLLYAYLRSGAPNHP